MINIHTADTVCLSWYLYYIIDLPSPVELCPDLTPWPLCLLCGPHGLPPGYRVKAVISGYSPQIVLHRFVLQTCVSFFPFYAAYLLTLQPHQEKKPNSEMHCTSVRLGVYPGHFFFSPPYLTKKYGMEIMIII